MIRQAKLEDFEAINSIFREVHKLHVENRPDFFRDIDPLPKEEFVNILKSDNQIILINEDEEINGFIKMEFKEKGETLTKKRRTLSIEQLGVKKSNHKSGIGRKLIEEAIKIFKEGKFDKLILDVWTFNQNAIDFYKHLGFKEFNIKMELEKEE